MAKNPKPKTPRTKWPLIVWLLSISSTFYLEQSDYPFVEAAKEAIDGYFYERNVHFSKHPKRAGQKIWRMERVPSEFREGQNCKDPLYQ